MVIANLFDLYEFGSESGSIVFYGEIMTLKNKLKYSDEIIVGIEALDHDYEKIFSLMNQIHDADIERNNNILSLVEQLVSYTKHHMLREELMMKACAYPYLDNHQQSCIDNLSKKTVEQLNHFLAD